MKPPVQYAMMPPRVDAPKVGKMKPVELPKVAKMRGIDAALDYYLGPTGIPDRLRALNSKLSKPDPLSLSTDTNCSSLTNLTGESNAYPSFTLSNRIMASK